MYICAYIATHCTEIVLVSDRDPLGMWLVDINIALIYAFLQGVANNTTASASSNATSKQWRLTPVKQSEKRADQVTTSLAEYTPTTIKAASDSALQSVSQAAQLAGRFSSAATANSLVAVTAAAQRSAQCTAAAATAVVEFSRDLADSTYGLGHRSSIAVYHGLEEASAGGVVSHAALSGCAGMSGTYRSGTTRTVCTY